jgi:hypothetical protein
MPRTARRYDIFLPLTYNDGRMIEDHKFDQVERQLLERFQGLTAQLREFPFRGIWQAESRQYIDNIILMTVLDFRPRGSTRFMRQLKRSLLENFDQLEILITESPLRIH